jgi:hypothetical protein
MKERLDRDKLAAMSASVDHVYQWVAVVKDTLLLSSSSDCYYITVTSE